MCSGWAIAGCPVGSRAKLRGMKTRPVFVVAVETYAFRAKLWQHHGPGAWYFVSLPADVADDIRARFGAQASGFGSIKS